MFNYNKFLIIFLLGISILFAVINFDGIRTNQTTEYGKNIGTKVGNCDVFEERVITRLVFICMSESLFDEPRMLPFLFTVMTLPLAGLLSMEFSKNRLAPIITVLVLFTSRYFSYLSPTVAGDGTWNFFLILLSKSI